MCVCKNHYHVMRYPVLMEDEHHHQDYGWVSGNSKDEVLKGMDPSGYFHPNDFYVSEVSECSKQAT